MNFYKLLLTLVFIFVVPACGGGSSSDGESVDLANDACGDLNLPSARIINGTTCGGLSSSPVVRLVPVDGANNVLGFCSGSMLTNRAALTAAHCIPGNTARIRIGGGNPNDLILADSSQIIIHPNFQTIGTASNEFAFNDVAIVILDRSLSIPTLPILLSNSPTSGQVVSIFGFGEDENGFFTGESLRSGEMQIDRVLESHIVAEFNGDGSNTCSGDSGGPMTVDVNGQAGIVGITSSGANADCSPGDTSAFVNLQSAEVLNFITANVPGVGNV